MKKRPSQETLDAVRGMLEAMGAEPGTPFHINTPYICDRCLDENREAFPCGLFGFDDLCNKCYDELMATRVYESITIEDAFDIDAVTHDATIVIDDDIECVVITATGPDREFTSVVITFEEFEDVYKITKAKQERKVEIGPRSARQDDGS